MTTSAINSVPDSGVTIANGGAVAPAWIRVASRTEVEKKGYLTVHADGHTVALFFHQERIYAVDNRCPHMGFPLDRGTVKDGILTCHWHHARFDLASGGTFDQWADDVPAFPVEVREDEVWIDTAAGPDPVRHQQARLEVGLERDIGLVIAKAVLTLLDDSGSPESAKEPFRTGLGFGARYRRAGWGQGLTMHVCFMNMLPQLQPADRPRGMVHGLSAVARDSAGQPPRFGVRPLPDSAPDIATLKRWFRRFVEVRDDEGAERCVVSALAAGADHAEMADMLFAAVTDRRYIDVGHPADFTNKALEALDIAGWDLAEPVLTSLPMGYANAARMEESNAWRNPVDLIEILQGTFEQLPAAWAAGAKAASSTPRPAFDELAQLVLQDDPQATADALTDALRRGYGPVGLAEVVCYAAARRIAQFHTSNEFGDWDTALHTFTFANAMHQGLRRAPSWELMRGVYDAAMSVYLDRFLNMPAARLPQRRGQAAGENGSEAGSLLDELAVLLDRQQQVNPAAEVVARYLWRMEPNVGAGSNGARQDSGVDEATGRLMAQVGKLLLREDRDFHTVQCVEAALRQATLTADATRRSHYLIAAIRYLAAHSPTVRAQGQTYQIATRLHRGEALFAEEG